MTVQYASRPEEARSYRFSVLRVLFCGLLLSVLTAVCLLLHHTAFSVYSQYLEDSSKKAFASLVELAGFLLPLIMICAFHGLVYHKRDRRDGVAQREMMWEIVFLTVFTYAVLYPLVGRLSEQLYEAAIEAGEKFPMTPGHEPDTLKLQVYEWFVRMTVTLGILMLFHGVRAHRERLYPDEMPDGSAYKAALHAAEQRAAAEAAAHEAEAAETNETNASAGADAAMTGDADAGVSGTADPQDEEVES